MRSFCRAYRHKIPWLLVLFVLTFVSSGGAVKAVSLPTSGQFDQVTTIETPRFSQRSVQSISFKGTSVRVDMVDQTQYVPLTQIQTPDAMYAYSPVANEAEKMPITVKQPPLLELMSEDTTNKLKGATRSGSVVFEGFNCDTYSLVAENGQENLQFWLSKDPKFPFILKTVATYKSIEKVETVQLENIELNNTLDDSFFQVPQNIRIVQAGQASEAGATGPGGAGAKH